MELASTGISIQQMMIFLAVVEQRNFTKVGEMFHLTQSAVSKSIGSMESELGFPLFSRTTRQVTVTPMGLALYEKWKSAVELIRAGNQAALAAKHRDENSLHVGVADTVDQNIFFWPMVERFEQDHPRLTWNVESNSFDGLKKESMDGIYNLAFMPDFHRDDLNQMGLRWTAVAVSEMEAIVPVSCPLFRKAALSLDELSHEHFIVLTDKNYLQWFHSLFEGRAAQPVIDKVWKSASQIENIYRPSEGLIFLADHYIRFPENQYVRRIPVPEHHNGLICCWKPAMDKRIAHDFIRFLSESLKENTD